MALRHAVDADHIAAVDNIARKLMQEGKRPAAQGGYGPLPLQNALGARRFPNRFFARDPPL